MSNTARTVYTGVTSDLERRVYEHQHEFKPGFTSKYHLHKLVYFETTSDVHVAIAREKQIKGWRRSRKISLIESVNPDWRDLSLEWADGTDSSPAGSE
jgi:putative endonuclease